MSCGVAIQHNMSFLLLLLLVVTSSGAGLAPGPGGPSSVITSMCSAVAKAATPSTPAVYKQVYGDCVGMLAGYPEAASAVDVRRVAIAAADLAASNVTNMEGFLQELIGNLQNCLGTFKAMETSVARATKDLRAGRIVNALSKLNFPESMPMQCVLPYMYAAKPSPINKELMDSIGPAALAISITELMAGKRP